MLSKLPTTFMSALPAAVALLPLPLLPPITTSLPKASSASTLFPSLSGLKLNTSSLNDHSPVFLAFPSASSSSPPPTICGAFGGSILTLHAASHHTVVRSFLIKHTLPVLTMAALAFAALPFSLLLLSSSLLPYAPHRPPSSPRPPHCSDYATTSSSSRPPIVRRLLLTRLVWGGCARARSR